MDTKATASKVLIIGAGPAGYTAAIYAARAGLYPLLITGLQPGGQLTITTDVENYPGFAESIQGPWLMEEMEKQAQKVGTQLIYDTITGVDFTQRPFLCQGEQADYFGETVIIATGASARWLGLESESYYRGYGVSACATCDGIFFKDQQVAVIGGGNTAVEDALFVARHAARVTLIHRRHQLRAEQILQNRLFACPNIEVRWNTVVTKILGTHTNNSGKPGEGASKVRAVTGLKLQNVQTQEITEMPIGGVFVAIGHVPNTRFLQGALACDAGGYIVGTGQGVETEIPGVYAAGDVRDHVYRQAVTAAAEGCKAAMDAEQFLSV